MDFKYITTLLEKIHAKIDGKNNIILITGDICSGKSYIVKKLFEKYNNKKNYVLMLSSSSQENSMEYSVFLSGLNKKSSFYKKEFLDVTTKIVENKASTLGLILQFFTNFKKAKLKHQFVSLNEVEIDILNRIILQASNKNIFIFADDIDKWDSESVNLLIKIISIQTDFENSFFPKISLVMTAQNDLNQIGSLSVECQLYLDNKLTFDEFEIELANSGISETKTVSELYKITNGNIGLVVSAKELIDLTSICSTEQLDKQIYNLLDKRFQSSNELSAAAISIAEAASIIGKDFRLLHLSNLLESIAKGKIEKNIEECCNRNIISEQAKSDLYTFTSHILHKYFYEKLSIQSKEYHYRMAKILANISPTRLYIRYAHLNSAGYENEAISLLTVHCMRQYLSGVVPNRNSLDKITKFQACNNALNAVAECILTYRESQDCNAIQRKLTSIDISVAPIIEIEKDYIQALIAYRIGSHAEHIKIHEILAEYFEMKNIDISQQIRIGVLLCLINCNRLGNRKRALEYEKEVLKIIRSFSFDEIEFIKEIRTLERISPALYEGEIAYIKTLRSLQFFTDNRDQYLKEYLMSLTNYLGVSIYLVGTNVAQDITWSSLYQEAFHGMSCVSSILSSNIYGTPKFINNFVLVSIFANKISLSNGIDLYSHILSEEDHIPSKPLIQCNLFNLFILNDSFKEKMEYIESIYTENLHHEYYRFITGATYINALILTQNFSLACEIYNNLDRLTPTISCMDKKYIEHYYDVIQDILMEEKQFTSVKEFYVFFEQRNSDISLNFPEIWKIPLKFSDLQYWSEY